MLLLLFLNIKYSNGETGDSFVEVNGTDFYLNGKPFYFAGTNAYYLWYGNIDCSSPGANQGCVIPLFNDAKSINLSVIRTWGFCNGGYKYGYCFQPSAGSYNEATFAHFDRVIKEASDRNLKLIITLVNSWDDVGGMSTYNSWCNLTNHDDFYTNACTKTLYKNYVNYFINRINTITGVRYKDDPTIFAWELANEPRCTSDKTGVTLNNWINEMSAYIKSIDSNHLVTTGVDGGYVNKGSNPWAWWYKGNEGQDYYSNHNWNTIDFATFHYYSSMDPTINANTWIQEHIQDAHNIIGKPVLFEEFNSNTNMAEKLSEWYSLMKTNNVNGDTFWMLSDNYFAGNNDSYFILCPEDTEVCSIIKEHALYMHNKTNPPVKFLINLNEGWNLISFPLELLNKTAGNIFPQYAKILAYTNKWVELGNNSEINESKGYWVKVNDGYNLEISGKEFKNLKLDLSKGWNLIGYMSLNETPISDLFNNTTVYMYNNSEWYSYNSNRSADLNTLSTLKPGYGYWVKK